MRAAGRAASTSKKRDKELPCLLMCPSRCLRALGSSHEIIPTYVPICLTDKYWDGFAVILGETAKQRPENFLDDFVEFRPGLSTIQ
jgi:hypothetical protein